MTTKKEIAPETPALKSYVDDSFTGTMEDLLNGSTTKHEFATDTIVKGKIVEIRPDCILVDIGYKAEGEIPASEVRNMEELSVGDELDVYLTETENETI